MEISFRADDALGLTRGREGRRTCGFGEYGCPESHAYSFALLAYVSLWLKCHEPAIHWQAVGPHWRRDRDAWKTGGGALDDVPVGGQNPFAVRMSASSNGSGGTKGSAPGVAA